MAADLAVPIAIIGMGCRLPGGAHSPEKLWDMLSEGRSGRCVVPDDRWNAESFYHPEPEAKESINARHSYFLQQDIAAFDARFFGVHAPEAHTMDPQQRILLETTYEALENAGIPLQKIKGSDTSVFMGVYARDYDRMIFKDLSHVPKLHMIGTGEAIVSNRISYLFDLKGPSMTIDTGCSGSMVAVHQACQGLRTGESRMAIVGGTQLVLTPDQMVPMSMVGMTNPDGRCYVFDSRGQGYARGEGVATLILKRLDDAIADGDPVHAIVRNSGLNQDGKTLGISLPNEDAQEDLMRKVYAGVDLNPLETGYVEAHGTGTQAGDNAEITSIARVFTQEGNRDTELYVGSVKSNIGHLEATSGIAGLMKAVLILKHGMIPPNLDFETPKKNLRLDERKIKILTELTPLPVHGTPRVSVNSFGYGGTNAHIILDAAPKELQHGHANGHSTPEAEIANGTATNGTNGVNGTNGTNGHTANGTNGVNGTNGHTVNGTNGHATNGTNGHATNGTNGVPQENGISGTNGTNGIEAPAPVSDATVTAEPELLVLTARSEDSLRSMGENLLQWISAPQRTDEDIHDLSTTLATRRTIMNWRNCLVVSTKEQLIAALSQKLRSTKVTMNIPLVFLFTGQGAQWFGMGRELISTQSAYKDSLVKSDKILASLGSDWSIVEELLKDEADSRIGQSEIAQPACTAVQLALVELLASLDIHPQAVLGHSSGEISAAYAAGILTHEAALEVSYRRGFLSEAAKRVSTAKGSMMAVGLGDAEVSKYIELTRRGLVSVACVNSPDSTTISGDEPAIDELKELLDAESIFNRKLKVDTAYHSHHMKKVSHEYLNSISHIKAGVPRSNIRFFSSVSGIERSSGFGPSYWVENLVSKVCYSDALQQICKAGLASLSAGASTGLPMHLFVELGPHSALSGPTRQTITGLKNEKFKYQYISGLLRGQNAVQTILNASGLLFENGYPMNLEKAITLHGSGKPGKTISDLAPYPWDHSSKYWNESYLSKDHRLRNHPYHDLLGLRSISSTVHEPSWRNILDIKTLPWLRDHQVDGFIIYPGAAYLCMALEGLRQITLDRGVKTKISKYIMRNVSFSKSIVIPDLRSDGLPAEVEIQLTLRPAKDINDRHSWETFRVLSLSPEGTWSEHCSGLIKVDFVSAVDEVEGTREEDFQHSMALDRLKTMQDSCTLDLDQEALYSEFAVNGNVFGPNFANVTGARLCGEPGNFCGVSNIIIPDIAKSMPKEHQKPHIVHPVILDAISHLGIPLYKRHCSSGPVMPISMDEVVISADISSTPGTKLIVASKMISDGPKVATMDTMVFQENEDKSLTLVTNVIAGQLRGVGETLFDQDSTVPFSRKMSYRINWKDDVNFLRPEALRLEDVQETPAESAEVAVDSPPKKRLSSQEELALNERAAAIFVRRAVNQLGDAAETTFTKPHLVKLYAWMQKYASSETLQDLVGNLTPAEEDELIQQTIDAGVEGVMAARIGRNLHAILTGETDSLDLMLQDNLLQDFYSKGLIVPNYIQSVEYLKFLAHKNPYMTILEVGAGTGGATLPLIKSLQRDRQLMLNRYHYTDISAGFFEQGKALLHEWQEYFDFKTLDISQDPIEQGFEAGSYDLIIASNVLHATASLDETVANVRKLLKPGGRLMLIELTRLTAAINIIFGTLPGWWASEDGRTDCPLVTDAEWDKTLASNGYNGVEFVTHDHEGPTGRSSMIVSKALDTPATDAVVVSKVEIICDETSPAYQGFVGALSAALEEKNMQPSTFQWSGHSNTEVETIYVVIDDAKDALLLNASPERYIQWRNFLTTAKSVLWISAQEDQALVRDPAKGAINGIGRVVRRENGGLNLVTLDIQQVITSESSHLIRTLSEVLVNSFCPATDALKSNEFEYAYKNNTLLVPRVQTDIQFNTWVDKVVKTQSIESGLFHQADRPLKLEVETPGLLSSLRFVDDEVCLLPLDPSEIEIETKAYGVNFKDVFIAMGQMLPGVKMAGECSGMVTKVGSALQHRFKVGDRVCGRGESPFCSRARVKGYLAHQIPDWMSFAVGASIPVISLTAYHCIIESARLKKGQSILIHAASGGVGQSAIMLAQNIGAEIFATVGSTAKKQLLMDAYGIPESHIFSTRTRNFKEGILRLTANRGVDVVLNSLSGEYLHDSLAVLAALGTFVEIGKADIYKKNQISLWPFDKHITFSAVDLTVLERLRPDEMQERVKVVLQMFEDKVLHAVEPITTIPMTNIEDAFRLIQSRKHTGKVVVTAESDTMVSVISARPPSLKLEKEGTYVIAGGLGDLGRRLARLMAAHGAGHIITLSRRKLDPDFQKELEDDIRALGGELHIEKCDITDKATMQEIADRSRKTLPPFKGLVHGGMVLRDRPIEQMSIDEYMAAAKPKINGTYCLDEVFGTDTLDFFIMLSSITGILGKPGQGNYAAGNSFQDAYSQSKTNSKTRYTTVNLGAIEGSESITSLGPRQEELMRQGSVMMSFDELYKLFEYAMSPQATADGLVQTMTGFDRQSMEEVHDEFGLTNPMFGHIPRISANKEAEAKGTSNFIDVEKCLRAATSTEEVVDVIITALAERFSMFSTRPLDEINLEAPLGELGLDSLVAIELKNWLVRTFHAAVQTSEVVDALSITKLAQVTASRSKLVHTSLGGLRGDDGEAEAEEEVTETAMVPNHAFQCCRLEKDLKKQPILTLDDLLQLYLDRTRPFVTAEEFQSLCDMADDLKKPDGAGRKIYGRLETRANDPNVENWIEDWYLDMCYVARQNPLSPFSNFIAVHPLIEAQHGQAERAAIVAATAFKSKQELEAGEWEGISYMGSSNCTDLWGWLFGTTRLPKHGQDKMVTNVGSDHMVAMHRGHVYKVLLAEGGENLSYQKLKATFEKILETEKEDSWLGILSADDRNEWAKYYEILESQSETNKEFLDVITEAAFVVNLDDATPEGPHERVRHFMQGDGFNRWNDKALEFIVCANGISGTFVEHSMIDALTLTRLQTTIKEAIESHSPDPEVNGHVSTSDITLQEIICTSTPEVDDRILQIRERFLSDTANNEYADIVHTAFGKQYLMSHGYPIKGTFDVLLQLASYYFHDGHNPASWEAVSMSHFHKGRPDIVQVVTPLVASFCSHAEDENISLKDRKESFLEAANDYSDNIRKAGGGKCYVRTLLAMERAIEEDDDVPALLRNQLFFKTLEPAIMTSATDGLSPESGFFLRETSNFWMTYYVTEEGGHVSLTGGHGRASRFAECIKRAGETVRKILDA
ncbi:Type I Iterative Polyketide synthase (PKS) [Pseudogymnoascus sp. 03VT05]|nr:Type I Iterative Polyketide synthase (PKS) [Pseudogymnoascus sp. 03VT05]